MKLKRKIFSKNILIFLFFIFFAGGVGFAQNTVPYGMLAPESETTIIWNNSKWTYSDGSDVNWGGSVAAGGHPDQNLILDTSKASITIILETDWTWYINNLYIFGENECVFILNGFSFSIGNLYLGDSCSSVTSIDSLINSGVITQNGRKGNIKIENGNFNIENGNFIINGFLNTSSPGKHSINLQETTLKVSSGWNTGTEGTGAEVPIFTSNNGKIDLNQSGLNGDFQTEIIDSVTNVNSNTSVTPPSDPTPTEAIWEGTDNSSWDNPNNWNDGAVLDGSMPIIIDGAATNQPVIDSEKSFTFADDNKIAFINEATLTIETSGTLTIDSEKFDFQTNGSKIIVNGTLNLTKDSTIDDFIMDSHFDSNSTGKIYCSDKVNHLVIATTFSNLNSIEKDGEDGDITIFQNVKCESINANSIIIRKDTAPTVEFGSITADSIQNGGALTVNSKLQVSSIVNQNKLTIADSVNSISQLSFITNDAELILNVDTSVEEVTNNQNGKITVAEGEYLDVKKQFSNNGIFTGSIKFSGDNITENNILGDSNSEYKELLIDTTKSIQFEGDSVIETLEVENAESVKFLSAITINKIDDNFFTGDFYFDATKFDQNTGGLSTLEGFKFNTSGDVYIGKDSNSQISFVNTASPVNFTHTAGRTIITGNLSANDVTLGETEISGTVNANDINCGNTTIAGNVVANNITLAENTIDGTITGTEITLGKTTLNGNITGTDVEIGDVELNGSIIGNNITLAEINVVENSELKINETSTDRKITLNGNVLSTDSKTLTLDGNVDAFCSSINLNQGTLESNGTFTAQNDLEIDAVSTFENNVDAKGNLTITGESVFKDAVKAGENLKITGNAAFESTEKSVEVGNDFTINGNANFANTVTTGNNLTITGNSKFSQNVVVGNIVTLQGNVEFWGTFSITQDTGYLLLNGTGNQDVTLNADDIYKNIIVEKTSGNVEIYNVAKIENFENSTAGTTTFNAASTITNYTNTKGNSIFKDVSKITSYTNESGKSTFEEDAEIAKLINKDTLEFSEKITSTESVENNGTITINGEATISSLKNTSETSEVQFNQTGNVETLENKGKVFVNENVSAKNVENEGKITIAVGKIFAISGTLKDNNEICGDGTIKINGTENQNVTLTTKENIGYKNIVVEKTSGNVEIYNVAKIENFENATEETTIFNAAAIITNYTNTKGNSIFKEVSKISSYINEIGITTFEKDVEIAKLINKGTVICNSKFTSSESIENDGTLTVYGESNISSLKNDGEVRFEGNTTITGIENTGTITTNGESEIQTLENSGTVEVNGSSKITTLKNTAENAKVKINAGTTFDLIENAGLVEINEDSTTKSLKNTKEILIAEGKSLTILEDIEDSGEFSGTGALRFTGNAEQLITLKENANYPHIVVDKDGGKITFTNAMTVGLFETENSPETIFENKMIFTDLKIQNGTKNLFKNEVEITRFEIVRASETKFESNVSVGTFTDKADSGRYIFNKNASFATETIFNTTETVSFGSDENSTITFESTDNYVSFTHTAGKTLITGNLSAKDVTLSETEISGTVNAYDINCGNTTIAGNVVAKKITLAENTIEGTVTGTEITLGKTKLNGNITGTDVEIGDVELNGSIIGNNITLAEIIVVENSELKINETSTDGKITLKGNVTSDSKNLTLNGNVDAFCSSINLGTLESKGTFTAQNDLVINAVSIFENYVDAKGNLTITGESVFKDAVKAGENLEITGNAAFESTEKSVEVGNNLTINGNANFANTVTTGNNLTIEGDEIIINGAVIAGKSDPFTEGSILLTGTTKITANSLTATKDITLKSPSVTTENIDAKNDVVIEGDKITTTEIKSESGITLNGNVIETAALNAAKDVTIEGTTINAAAVNATNNIFINKDSEVLEQTLNITGDVSSNNFEVVAKTQTFGGTISVTNDFISKGESLIFGKAVAVKNDFILEGETFVFSDTITVDNAFSCKGTQLNFAKAVTAKNMNLSGDEITFAGKVTVNQDAQIQNTGLLKISDFVYGKSFVQKGSEAEIGQVMISGSFEQFEESGETENPTATFDSNVYFYNSSQNSLDITIGSDKSSILIDGNLIIAKSKENDVAIKGTVKSNKFALYSGNVDLSGNLEIDEDVVILGENYSLKDNQTGIENLYSYTENRPAHWSQASYTFETSLPDGTEISKNYAGTVKVAKDKSITVGKNLYANGTVFALSGALGSGKWKLNVPDTSVAANAFCEVYNSEVSDCDAAYQIAALQCTDKSGNQNWAFDDETGTVKITKAYSVSDNVIRVEFNKPVRILKDRFTQKQMRFSNEPDENHYFENVYLDEKCTTEASEVVNQYYEENGSKNYYVYVKANSKWNTDATGTFVGEEKSTDYDGVHQNTTICLDFPRAIVATTQSGQNFFSYIITDLWGKRLTNYSARTTSGTQKIPFENVEDKTGPVLISVKTGQENHTEYDGTKGAQSQPSYDSHNFIEFVYSEFVNFGSENSNGAEEVFLKADDQGIENAKNIQVTQKFGVLQNEDITQSGQLKFAGLAKIQNGKIYTGSLGNADKYVNALYRFDKYSLRYSIAGYTHPTEFVQDDQGNNHKKWIGYIQEAELPTGTVSMICDGKNDLVFDMAGNSQTLVKNNLTVNSSKSGVYGNWDISKPIFAPLRMKAKDDWSYGTNIEALGNNSGFGSTIDRIEFHLFDNTPDFTESDEYSWITEKGWCYSLSSDLYTNYSYAADIFGGSRPFIQDEKYRTSGGIRFSSLENASKGFLYTTNSSENPKISFDNSKPVIIGANAKLFTGKSSTRHLANKVDGLYFSLLLKNDDMDLKTVFTISYNDELAFITDLAGNRLLGKTVRTVDRTSPSLNVVLSPINQKDFYVSFLKSINEENLVLVSNDEKELEVTESIRDLLPQCFEIIKINNDGSFELADIQVDKSVVAQKIDIVDDENYTVYKMSLTRNVSLEDVKKLHVRIVNPEKYDYTMRDPVTNIQNSLVTLIQDNLGNYIDKYQTHSLSDIAINAIVPLYAFSSSINEENLMDKEELPDYIKMQNSNFSVRDWDRDQQNYGTLLTDKEISIIAELNQDETSTTQIHDKFRIFLSNVDNLVSEKFNREIGGNLRIWFPDIMEKSFNFFSLNKNKKYETTVSSVATSPDVEDCLRFDLPFDMTNKWKSGDQISFIFSILNDDNSQYCIYPAPIFDVQKNIYTLQKSAKYPLFAIRMENPQDITTLDLWSFRLKNLTEQRGGVSILNNVINATYGEKAVVKVNVPQDSNVDVIVMTLDGNIVTYLQHGAISSGEHYFTWNGTNMSGTKVARGLYFVRVIGPNFDETRKVMVVKD